MHLPFGGIHQTLTPLMRHLDTLPPGQRNALATAFGLAEGAKPDLFLIAEAALALLTRERRERAVLIVVDDVHWLDPQSHQILTFLAHRGTRAGDLRHRRHPFRARRALCRRRVSAARARRCRRRDGRTSC